MPNFIIKIKYFLFFSIFFPSNFLFSQVGINTTAPNANSVLDVFSNDKGLLLPRISLTNTNNANPLASHVAGMVVYNTATVSDVVPGVYVNNGSKWISICDSNFFQDQINNTNQQIPVKRAVIVAGQSNTHFGGGAIASTPSDFDSKGMIQLGRNVVDFQEVPLTFYNTYQHSQQIDRASFSSMFCYHYYNELKAAHPSQDVKVLLIPCGSGASAWDISQYPSNSWRTNCAFWSDLIARIKWAKSQGYQIDAILWHQGETDAMNNTINYKDIILNFIQSIREQVGNQKLPFILGEMLPSWVAAASNRVIYQGIINSIPSEVPYTYTVSGAGLTSCDLIHYSADAHLQLGLRYYNGFTAAKLNVTPSSFSVPTIEPHLLLNHNSASTTYFPDIFSAIRYNDTNPTNVLHSKLGDIWKYRNNDGFYHFKLEIVNGTGISGGIFEWKQKFNPFGLNETQTTDRYSSIIINNTIGLDPTTGQGFASLVYDNPYTVTDFTSLFHADIRVTWWFAIGQTFNFSNKLAIVQTNNTVNHIRFYAIKE